MPKTIYSNAKHPTACKWSLFALPIMAIALFIFGSVNKDFRSIVFFISILFASLFSVLSSYFLYNKVVIDEDLEIIYQEENSNYPVRIGSIMYVTCMKSKKGNLRALLIHEDGTRFMEVRLRSSRMETILKHILELNPEIEVRQGNYY